MNAKHELNRLCDPFRGVKTSERKVAKDFYLWIRNKARYAETQRLLSVDK